MVLHSVSSPRLEKQGGEKSEVVSPARDDYKSHWKMVLRTSWTSKRDAWNIMVLIA